MTIRSISGYFLMLFAFGITVAQTPSRAPKLNTVTGYYHNHHAVNQNSLEVLQLPGGKIKFYLLALWVSPYNRENLHIGELRGIVALEDNTAAYASERCKVTMKFLRAKVVVTQSDAVGDCDFGASVSATGTYRKLDGRRPKFDF